MVFVPPDRTLRRERAARGVAGVLVTACALMCLGILLFAGSSSTRRIAVVHRVPAAFTSTGSSESGASAAPVTTAAITSRLPLPSGATKTVANVPTWHAAISLTSAKRFYLRHVGAHGLAWHPRPVRSGGRLVAWVGTLLDGGAGRSLGRLTVRSASPRLVTITVTITLRR